MNVLRRAAGIALWVLAGIGVACGIVWAATAAGYIKPLVVISGSMEPGIMTGDLVIDTQVDTASLHPGDVVSLHSDLTGALVTHRIQAIEPAGSGYSIVLKGDANDYQDPVPYAAGAQVWHPSMQISGVGGFVSRLTTPGVAFPLLLGLFALLGLLLLIPAPPKRVRRDPGIPAAHSSAP